MPVDGFTLALIVLGVLIVGGVLGKLSLRLHLRTGTSGKSVTVSLEVRSRWASGDDTPPG
jgi:hypothetical protein